MLEGFVILFRGECRLFGDYGGINGKLVGAGTIVEYGFYRIDVCDQSPVILTFKTTVHSLVTFPVCCGQHSNYKVCQRWRGQVHAHLNM